jgi:hypothetical protein
MIGANGVAGELEESAAGADDAAGPGVLTVLQAENASAAQTSKAKRNGAEGGTGGTSFGSPAISARLALEDRRLCVPGSPRVCRFVETSPRLGSPLERH